MLQIKYLRDLNRRGDSESVICIFESGQAVSNEATLGEYVKALVAADRLDTSSLIRTLQVGPWPFQMHSSQIAMLLLAPPELANRWEGTSADTGGACGGLMHQPSGSSCDPC